MINKEKPELHTLDLSKKATMEDMSKMSISEGVYAFVKRPEYPETCFRCGRPFVNHFAHLYLPDPTDTLKETDPMYKITKFPKFTSSPVSLCCLCIEEFFIADGRTPKEAKSAWDLFHDFLLGIYNEKMKN